MPPTNTEFIFDGPAKSPLRLVLAHGAGAPMDSPFMNVVAKGVGDAGVRVARFEFPYMAARREGKRKPPDRAPILMETWRQAITELGGGERLVIGGKSMGGRIASMVADEVGAAGLVCLGYPFHPPGNPERTRTKHLETMRTRALIIQGQRDSFGKPEEVAKYKLSPKIRIAWIAAGDHSLKPPARSGRTEAENLEEAIDRIRKFIASLSK
jgi:uncharacterized protein